MSPLKRGLLSTLVWGKKALVGLTQNFTMNFFVLTICTVIASNVVFFDIPKMILLRQDFRE